MSMPNLKKVLNSESPLKAFLIWVILLLSTITAWVESTNGSLIAIMLVIFLAFIKVLLVIYSYMEVAGSAAWLQFLCGFWMLIAFGIILFCYTQPELVIIFIN